MTDIKTCSIKLLNKTYKIKCPESEESNLTLAASKLNECIANNKNKSSRLDEFDALLLAALDVSRELVLSKKEQEQQRHQVNQFITSLESKINKTVGGELFEAQATD